MMRSCWVVVFLLATAGAVCLAQSEAPSLGDLAKQQRSGKKATIVVSDDDVVNVPASAFDAAPSSTPSAPSVPGKSSGAAQDASAKGSSSDAGTPANGSTVPSELKSKLDRLKVELDGWKRVAKRNEDLLASETSEFRRKMYQDALDNDRKNVALYGAEIDRVQTQLSNASQTSPRDSGQSGEAPASGSSKQP